ncbi:lanthionine synthetase LanC family protein [Jidongwangia harbinensis]|uniref:lanthionine synthetase LanC family protein n=1 Tax=Jidongwangia harbinensis TaxID=2878561 RepID=UPI001CDA037D|nr:lanthionine synthetase LanC family protein [Jidongwangia harbinensis]MCA2215057.1 hypothetical protein [Jidongwangia harbinensis]
MSLRDTAPNTAAVLDAAGAVLDAYTARSGPGGGPFEDPGVLLVAAMVADAGPPGAPRPVPAAVRAWLARCRGGAGRLGVNGGGMAGFVLALTRASGTWPELAPTAATMRARLAAAAAGASWRRDRVGWDDYDLISGPSGTLAVLAGDPAGDPADGAPIVAHLTALCGTPDLAGLRVGQYRDDVLRAFNVGRVNAGIGHGAPGVAVGLRAAADAGALPAAGYAALRRVTDWLVAQSYVDGRGVRSWPSTGRAVHRPVPGPTRHVSRRQAWCYGNPGIAWALWEAARVLDDPGLSAFAADAAGSFLTGYDDDVHLDEQYPDRVGVCHGAAGLLLVMDAFDRYARLPGAGPLRDHLAGVLEARLDRLVRGPDTDLSLLAGAAGVVAALLSLDGTGDRRWLSAFGLR